MKHTITITIETDDSGYAMEFLKLANAIKATSTRAVAVDVQASREDDEADERPS